MPARVTDDDRYFLDRFQAMPRDGYTRMFERMLDHPRIDLALGTDFHDLDRRRAPLTIYTGPIDRYFGHRFGALPYRSLEFRFETHDRRRFQEVGVVNYPDAAVPWTRITEYKHLTGQVHPQTTISYEIARAEGDPFYPIPRAENRALYRQYDALARTIPGVVFTGRLGSYQYFNMDQVVGQALATYRRLAALRRRRPRPRMAEPLHVLLATDSAEPSGLGQHMLTLGRGLARTHRVTLAFPEAAADFAGARRARRASTPSTFTDEAALLAAVRPGLLHVHAGIGWEGHALAAAGAAAGLPRRADRAPAVAHHRRRRRRRTTPRPPPPSTPSSRSPRPRRRPGRRRSPACGRRRPPRRDPQRRRAAARRPHPRRDPRGARHPGGRAAPPLRRPLHAPEGPAHPVQAVRALHARGLRPRLLLVGEGPERAACEAEAQGCAAIAFLGRRDDVGDLMAAADLLALPSRFEGLPLVVLEAMSLGLPVVATRIDSVVEALGADHPFLAEPGDAEGLADTLATALAAPRRTPSARPGGDATNSTFTAGAHDLRDRGPLPLGHAARPPSAGDHHAMLKVGFIGAGGIAHRHLGVLATFDDVTIAGIADPDEARAARRRRARPAPAPSPPTRTCSPRSTSTRSGSACPPSPTAPPSAPRSRPAFPSSSRSRSRSTPPSPARSTTRCATPGSSPRSATTGATSTPSTRPGGCSRDNPAHLMSGYWLDQTPPPDWWHREDRSGGQIVEQATHIIDLARFLAGDVTEVFGLAAARPRDDFPGLDVATASTAALRFASGAIANLSATCLLRWSHRVGLHVFADGLALELTDHDLMVDVGRGRPVRGADGDPVWRQDRAFLDAVKGGENRIRAPYAEARADPPRRPRRRAVRPHRGARHAWRGCGLTRSRRFAPPLPRAPVSPDAERTVRSLGVERPGEPFYAEYREGPAGPGEVRLDLRFTGLSAGTELTFLKGTNPYLHARWDDGRGVFVPGEPSARYPVPFMGYMEVAEVVASSAPGFAPGDIVAGTFGHKTGHTADPAHELLVAAAAATSTRSSASSSRRWVRSAPTASSTPTPRRSAAPARRSAPASPAARSSSGAPAPSGCSPRSSPAAPAPRSSSPSPPTGGAPSPAASASRRFPEDDAWAEAKRRWHGPDGRGADVVFQTRARADSLDRALKALRPQGTVIDLAFYQGGARRHPPRRGLPPQRPRHPLRPDRPRAPRLRRRSGTAAASPPRPSRCSRAEGDAIRRHLITHVVPFDDGADFLRRLPVERPDFLQIVFAR